MLNKALRLIRLFHDLKQKELAKRLDISRSYLSEIEAGRKVPALQILYGYSALFNIPTSSIMFLAENIENSSRDNRQQQLLSGKVVAMLDFMAVNQDPSVHHK